MKLKVILLVLFVINNTMPCASKKFLVFGGKTGWIGQQIVTLLVQKGHQAICSTARLESEQQIIEDIENNQPDFIINAAGITGRPNVDWCEDHQQETMLVNVTGTLGLIRIACQRGIHVTNISTGCIYTYNETHALGTGIGFTEKEIPNFEGSFYSRTKVLLEQEIMQYPDVLHLRIRMPISDDLSPRGFIGKLVQYPKLVNIPNSAAVLHDLLPIVILMAENKIRGIYNFVNPGTISHNEIMELYKQYINPNHVYQNFSTEEQAKILRVPRSNCELDSAKLLDVVAILDSTVQIPHIKESIVHVFERMHNSMNNE